MINGISRNLSNFCVIVLCLTLPFWLFSSRYCFSSYSNIEKKNIFQRGHVVGNSNVRSTGLLHTWGKCGSPAPFVLAFTYFICTICEPINGNRRY